MKNNILISIKPEYTNLIELKEKTFEFRNYLIPNIKYMTIYESNTSCIKYIMEVSKPICYPNKIDEDGIGNKEFNLGSYKYAYPIVHLKKLEKPITLTEMRNKYNAFTPQKYVYMDKYPLLNKEINNRNKIDLY